MSIPVIAFLLLQSLLATVSAQPPNLTMALDGTSGVYNENVVIAAEKGNVILSGDEMYKTVIISTRNQKITGHGIGDSAALKKENVILSRDGMDKTKIVSTRSRKITDHGIGESTALDKRRNKEQFESQLENLGSNREMQLKESEISGRITGLQKKIQYAEIEKKSTATVLYNLVQEMLMSTEMLEYEQKRDVESRMKKLESTLHALKNELKQVDKNKVELQNMNSSANEEIESWKKEILGVSLPRTYEMILHKIRYCAVGKDVTRIRYAMMSVMIVRWFLLGNVWLMSGEAGEAVELGSSCTDGGAEQVAERSH
ncbi:hypothetical protein Q3G72_016526 [Acer saccharum]|nr:hypothetical protein Q3G72_016526 [Acer saccharum]